MVATASSCTGLARGGSGGTSLRLTCAFLVAATSSCGFATTSAQAAEVVRPTVLATYPHDAAAFTQGLLFHEGVLYESTGLYGESTLREVDPESGRVLRSMPLLDDEFGEGLALVDERLIQLTWRNGVAYEYARTDFERLRSLPYDGEGWGLCYDGRRLVMSDGSNRLTFRDPDSFDVVGSVEVTLDGDPVEQLNELECVGGQVFANVWQTNWIVEIDPAIGAVTRRIDASGLLSANEAAQADVLNGVAYDETTERFFITGKLWPKLFVVRFGEAVAEPGDSADPSARDAGPLDPGPPDAALEPEEAGLSAPSVAPSALDASLDQPSDPSADASRPRDAEAPVAEASAGRDVDNTSQVESESGSSVITGPMDAAMSRDAGTGLDATAARSGSGSCAVSNIPASRCTVSGERLPRVPLSFVTLVYGFIWWRRATASSVSHRQ